MTNKQEQWEDGEEIHHLKLELERVIQRKHKIEKMKKHITKKGKKNDKNENSKITKNDDSSLSCIPDCESFDDLKK